MLPYSAEKNINFSPITHECNSVKLQLKNDVKIAKFISKSTTGPNPLVYKSQNDNYKLISRNFFVELINKFWSETIFLSKSNAFSDNYIDKLKSDGLSTTSQDYKNFLYTFSKALINDRIHVISNFLDNGKSKDDFTYIKYVWKKGFNFSWPDSNCYILSLLKNKNIINNQRFILTKNLAINKFPVFTVVNNLNQIILSESSNEILINKNLLDRIYNTYSKYFLENKNNQIKYQSLFFVNPDDANEYRNDINYKYNNFRLNSHLNIFTTRLDIYYYLMQMKIKNLNFRLIPDLKEVGKLVSEYQYYKHIRMHNNQYCLQNTFQGQPIYFIESILAKNKNSGKIELVKYKYSNHSSSLESKYTAVFMNYKTALLAWKKFRQQMFQYDLPIKPNLTVYNLESFIKKYDNNSNINLSNILFVPSIESYFYLKNTVYLNQNHNFINKFTTKYSSLQIFTKRIIWSLTSKQPINW